jgi:hypothetical protein
MKPDPFEQQLSQQPLRTLPPEWRQEILARAVSGLDPRDSDSARAISIRQRLRGWVWPHPVAWAGLGACWLAILTLDHLAAPSAAELAQAEAGARIAEALFAASRSPQAVELSTPLIPRPAMDRPRRGPGDQGRIDGPSNSSIA